MLHAAFLRNQLISLLILDSFQKASFKLGGVSKPMNLDIELVNCDITSFKGESRQQKRDCEAGFSGPRVSGHNEELDTSGGQVLRL